MILRYLAVVPVLACIANFANAAEESSPDWNTETLTGDWGGTRTNLSNKGINLEFGHKSDVLNNMSGGTQRGTAWMGNTEALASIDLEKLAGWAGVSATLHYHSQLGSKFGRDYVGGFSGVDNIEAGTNTAQFYQAWIQKDFSDSGLSLLGGFYPIDSEFYVTETSGVFIQPPYGMSNEVAQTGQNGPPVFPLGALALRMKYTPADNKFYLQGAITDGVPSDPNNPHGTHIRLNQGDGTLSIVEFGYTPPQNASSQGSANTGEQEESEYFNKTAIGYWRYSARFDDQVDTDADGNPLRRISQGAYFLAERTLMTEAGHPSQGLSGFVRFGTASKDIQQVDWTGSLGLRYHGLIDNRDDDIAGIAITVNHASNKYRQANTAESRQTDFEATYRAQVRPWLALQPTLQYIQNPNMDPAIKNAWVAGVRTEISF